MSIVHEEKYIDFDGGIFDIESVQDNIWARQGGESEMDLFWCTSTWWIFSLSPPKKCWAWQNPNQKSEIGPIEKQDVKF